MKKYFVFSLMFVCVIFVAFVPAITAQQVVKGGTLIMSGMQTPKNLGYQPTMSLIDKVGIFQTLGERLMNINKDGKLVPELATSVDVDPDANTITWHLRKGVKFHDGNPFNAEAAIWNFKQMNDAGVLQYGEDISDMTAVDDYTLRFTLKKLAYLHVVAFSINIYMFSPEPIKKGGKEWAVRNLYTTGPFMLDEFQAESRVSVKRNPNYWREGKPYLDKIILQFNLDSAVLSAAMQSDEIQMQIGGDGRLRERLVEKGFKRVVNTPVSTTYKMLPDSINPSSPLSNKKVREAIEYAIDQVGIVNGTLGGTSMPMNQVSYEGAVGYDPNGGRGYDVAKAKKLLEEAGYPGGVGKDGKQIELSLYGTTSAPSQAWRAAIAGYLAEVGIKATVVPMPFPTFATMQAEGWVDGLMTCVENSGAPYSIGFLNWFGPLPTNSPVPSLGRSDEYNALADQVLSATDVESMNAIVKKLVKMANDDAMILPLWANPAQWVAQPYVHVEEAEGGPRSFDWASVWMEKH